MRKKQWFARFGIAAVGLILCVIAIQCASISRAVITKPKVELHRVAMKDVTTSGATLIFSVQVENPNPFALKVDSVRYEVEIDGKPLGRGELEKPAEVAGNDKAIVDIPLPVLYKDLFERLADMLLVLQQKKTSQYHLKGEVKFGVLSVPIDSSGQIQI